MSFPPGRILFTKETGKFDFPDDHQYTNFIFLHSGSPQRQTLLRNWILLDNQSTVNVFSNPSLLKNIREVDKEMIIRCNAGVTRTRMIGDLPGYEGQVWYNPDGIANILSLADVKRHYQVTFDSENGGVFKVHKKDGKIREFIESPGGLYYMVASGQQKGHTLAQADVESTHEPNNDNNQGGNSTE